TAMQQRIESSDFTTRMIGGFCSNALNYIWCETHLYLGRPPRLLSFVLALIFATPLFAQTNARAADDEVGVFEIRQRQYLLGDWDGKRTALEEKGVKFDFFYVADLEANPSGGLQQTAGLPGTILSIVWQAKPSSVPMPDRIVASMRHSALIIV